MLVSLLNRRGSNAIKAIHPHPHRLNHNPPRSSSSSSPPQKQIEIERKFTRLSPSFPTNTGVPPFRTLRRLPTKTFTDTYLDFDPASTPLFRQGIYVRRRDGHVEAKIALPGHTFTDSRMAEVAGERAVREFLEGKAGVALAGKRTTTTTKTTTTKTTPTPTPTSWRLEELRPVAEIRTVRRRWLADGEFEVVWDETDFGFAVGEVELVVVGGGPVGGHGGGGGDGAEAAAGELERMRVAMGKLEAFMHRYGWAFGSGGGGEEVKGKLTAYFERFGYPGGRST